MSKRAEGKALEAYPRDEDRELNYRRANYRIAYERGYNQAEKDLGWHSVDESLPPIGEEVIVLTNVVNGRVVDPASYICFGHIVNKEYTVDYDGWNILGVKYWMPCPELPED